MAAQGLARAQDWFHKEPVCNAGRMAELESAAWKDDRRFRIMSVDQGVLSFVDLFMHTPSKPRTSAGPPSAHLHEDEGKNISITGRPPTCTPHLIRGMHGAATWAHLLRGCRECMLHGACT